MKPLAIIGCIVWFVLWTLAAVADERDNQIRLAPKYNAKVGVRLDDDTVCDLVSSTTAWEVDRPSHWYEGVGQAIHYADMTGKKPGVILLVSDPANEWRHIYRCAYLCGRHGIEFRVEKWLPVKRK